MSFFSRLEARARAVDSLLCVGLDPHTAELDAPTADAAKAFCLRLIEATAPFAAAFKPNAAFFEALGPDGVDALAQVIAAVPDGIPVILDVKRGDIFSTASAYATAAYDRLGADCVTLNAYMGRDAVAPFLEDPDKGAFLLCRTSNPSGGELQDLDVRLPDGRVLKLYEHVADLAAEWNDDNIGIVVGATRPDELATIRRRAPDLWILAPGVGAQGASLEQALAAGLRADGLGLLIAVSRGISRADDPAAAAAKLRDDIRAARAVGGTQPTRFPAELADGLLAAGCIRFGSFTLKSGLKSPIYIDLRRLIGFPALMATAATAYIELLDGLSWQHVAALPYAALPIGSAVTLQAGASLVYPRREAKTYGTKAAVEGVFEAGDTAVVLDDLATTGGSKIEALEKLHAVGLHVNDVVVLIDRESGATEAMAEAGVTMHAVLTLSSLLEHYQRTRAVTDDQVAEVRACLEITRP